ncbi:MAG: aldo/keto reductase [Acidobacteriota bacterium]|nr:aldo/keto reductase [Acidobacteriota bacterium]
MKTRRLGRTELEISQIGYGAWGIGGSMWIGATDKESLAALRRAIDLGVNFIDTALVYGNGHSEELVGKVVRETPHKVWVASKIPPKNRLWPAPAGVGIDEAFPRDYILRSTETSLKNLGLETIDLQQLHIWNPEWTDREEWRRAFEDLKTQGKVRAFGVSLSNHDPDSALGIIDTGLIDAVQVIYNIFDQTPERNLFPACLKHNVGVLARVPLDEGALTGRIHEASVFPEGDFRNDYFRGDRKKQVARRVDAMVNDLHLEGPGHLAGIAIRFCLSHPAVTSVIPGMRSIASVEGNVMASGQGPLPPSAMEILRRHAWDRDFYR